MKRYFWKINERGTLKKKKSVRNSSALTLLNIAIYILVYEFSISRLDFKGTNAREDAVSIFFFVISPVARASARKSCGPLYSTARWIRLRRALYTCFIYSVELQSFAYKLPLLLDYVPTRVHSLSFFLAALFVRQLIDLTAVPPPSSSSSSLSCFCVFCFSLLPYHSCERRHLIHAAKAKIRGTLRFAA